MTFTEIQTAITDRLDLTSTEALTRVGNSINRKYREITASLGIKHVSRRITQQATMTVGVSTLQFINAEKIVSVFNRSSAPYVQLEEVTVDELRVQQPYNATDTPSQYAIVQMAGDSATIEVNCTPQTAVVLYADLYRSAITLSGTDEPIFSESYHDILIAAVLVDEYMKVEKASLSVKEQTVVDKRMGELRLWIAVSTTKKGYQGKANEAGFGGVMGSGGGSGTSVNGAQSYTQTGLITFHRGSGAVPFAISDTDAAYVVNLFAEGVGNEATQTLIGRNTAGTGESEQITISQALDWLGT